VRPGGRTVREMLLTFVSATRSLRSRPDTATQVTSVIMNAWTKPPLTITMLRAKVEAPSGAAWVEKQVKQIVAMMPASALSPQKHPRKHRRVRASREHDEEQRREEEGCRAAAASKAVVVIGEPNSGTTLSLTLSPTLTPTLTLTLTLTLT
jgi:hypothetical protein